MADSEFILSLLENVTRRLRVIHRLRNLFSVLSIALIFPVVLKLIDLIYPLRGFVVAAALFAWAIATIAWILWKIRGSAGLLEAAASLDRDGRLQDQMKSAYWFIVHPSSSEWVDSLIDRAAERAKSLRLDALYPTTLPRSSKLALSFCLLFVLLNVLPFSRNHNWFLLQAAPPYRLSRGDQALLDHARKLLEKSQVADKLDQIVNELEQGKISSAEAQREISSLRQQIDSGNLELNNILDGLTAMANQLGQSAALESTAEAMSQGDLNEAADQIRDVAEKLGVTPEDMLREMQRNLAQAASGSPSALEDLSRLMQQTADSLKNGDAQAGKESLDSLARAMEQLADRLEAQQRQSQASQQLADLQNALQQEASADAASAQLTPIPSQGGSGSGDSGEASNSGAPAAGNSSGIGQGSSGGNNPGSTAFGSPEDLKPGDVTKLDVQLKMEGLKGQPGSGGKLQDIEEASRQERSLMDYRNVPSQLSPAQKDALNQNRLPREQREIVKYYFEEIRPQTPKPTKQ